jgi:hypothetical protein
MTQKLCCENIRRNLLGLCLRKFEIFCVALKVGHEWSRYIYRELGPRTLLEELILLMASWDCFRCSRSFIFLVQTPLLTP